MPSNHKRKLCSPFLRVLGSLCSSRSPLRFPFATLLLESPLPLRLELLVSAHEFLERFFFTPEALNTVPSMLDKIRIDVAERRTKDRFFESSPLFDMKWCCIARKVSICNDNGPGGGAFALYDTCILISAESFGRRESVGSQGTYRRLVVPSP